MAVADKQIHAGDGRASRSPARGRPELAVGHLLVQDQHHRLLHDFGQALGEA
jgi:hypothetical protein